MMTKAKSKYSADVFSENSDNPRRLCNSINNILHIIPPLALPEFTSVKSLCDHFSRYFVIKLKISVPNFQIKYRIFFKCKDQKFDPTCVRRWNVKAYFGLILKIWTPFLQACCKNCLDILLTPITDIINISMETSTFPQNSKKHI